MKLKFTYKGGKGSGFHGHAGRPGKQGGSAAEGIVGSHADVPTIDELTRQERHNLDIGDPMADYEEAARRRDAEGMLKALTKIQQQTLDAMEPGKWYSAYDLHVPLSTLNTLVKKKFVTSRHELGSTFSPRTSIMFKRKLT